MPRCQGDYLLRHRQRSRDGTPQPIDRSEQFFNSRFIPSSIPDRYFAQYKLLSAFFIIGQICVATESTLTVKSRDNDGIGLVGLQLIGLPCGQESLLDERIEPDGIEIRQVVTKPPNVRFAVCQFCPRAEFLVGEELNKLI